MIFSDKQTTKINENTSNCKSEINDDKLALNNCTETPELNDPTNLVESILHDECDT